MEQTPHGRIGEAEDPDLGHIQPCRGEEVRWQVNPGMQLILCRDNLKGQRSVHFAINYNFRTVQAGTLQDQILKSVH